MSAIVIIPARYASTRFPGKPLALLKGRPMIRHVYENSKKASSVSEVLVATDDPRIFAAVEDFGGKAVMTAPSHKSGTDRIAEAATQFDCDIIVNVQGDEPMIRPEMIDEVVSVMDDPEADIGTLARKITDPRDYFDPNAVKAVFGKNGFALYFSRAPIPWHRDVYRVGNSSDGMTLGLKRDSEQPVLFKHIGIYAYRKEALARMAGLPESALERIEKLEQLRALENGMKIKIRETFFETIGVDTPEDLERMENA